MTYGAMKLEHYLDHTGLINLGGRRNGAKRERERKARTTLLMAIPEDHLAKFHKMTDAKDMWIAIKSSLVEMMISKKMAEVHHEANNLKDSQYPNSDGITKDMRDSSSTRQLGFMEMLYLRRCKSKVFKISPSAWLQVSLDHENQTRKGSLVLMDLYINL
ncbi:hypothetical protein Tco_0241918 [Tanacetum coccineum]